MHAAKIVFYVHFAHTCAKYSASDCNMYYAISTTLSKHLMVLEHIIDSSYNKLLRLIMIQGFYQETQHLNDSCL